MTAYVKHSNIFCTVGVFPHSLTLLVLFCGSAASLVYSMKMVLSLYFSSKTATALNPLAGRNDPTLVIARNQLLQYTALLTLVTVYCRLAIKGGPLGTAPQVFATTTPNLAISHQLLLFGLLAFLPCYVYTGFSGSSVPTR